jgi:hypothetical protein
MLWAKRSRRRWDPPTVRVAMAVTFQHQPHPQVAARKRTKPPQTTDAPSDVNGRIALLLTRVVGTMWCAYAFACLALVALPSALSSGDTLAIVQWVSQTFIQLVMLSVIMVGQNILGKAADRRSEMTYKDAEATFHEAEQIQKHLAVQDEALNRLLAQVATLEAALASSSTRAAAPEGSAG